MPDVIHESWNSVSHFGPCMCIHKHRPVTCIKLDSLLRFLEICLRFLVLNQGTVNCVMVQLVLYIDADRVPLSLSLLVKWFWSLLFFTGETLFLENCRQITYELETHTCLLRNTCVFLPERKLASFRVCKRPTPSTTPRLSLTLCVNLIQGRVAVNASCRGALLSPCSRKWVVHVSLLFCRHWV